MASVDEQRSFMSIGELRQAGFAHVGDHCQISRKCSWYAIHPDSTIGDHVRIDDFCIFKGRIRLAGHIHISAFSMVSGAQGQVTMEEFSILSARCTIYTGSNDHSGDYLGGPQAPTAYTNVTTGPVTIGIGVLIGAHCVILPNVDIGAGAAIGANCVVSENVPEGGMLRAIKPALVNRRRNVLRIKEFALRVLENEVGEP